MSSPQYTDGSVAVGGSIAQWVRRHRIAERFPYLSGAMQTVLIGLQLGLVIVAIYVFGIVSRAFLYLCILAFCGFLVHAHLPRRFQLPFFLTLSLAGLNLVMGPVGAAWVVGLGLGLVALCHLPVGFAWRVALVIAAGAILAVLRAADDQSLMPATVLPILGSMFMFRMIVYLYDLRSEKPGTSKLWPLSYFFLLPNVVFPLFPLVDYKQFRATYFNQDPWLIYQRGVNWVFRGVYHLLLYRLIYVYFTVDPETVSGTADLVQYSVSSFLLYLRVSGTFHLATGILLLFGFNVAETHHHYYLASNFTDFWRRINIYWKEFMRRIVFFPVHFYLKPLGSRTALVLATAVVFIVTWFLHSYQWFWLTGSWLLEWHDTLFWAVLGVLVVINVLYDDKYGTDPTWRKGLWTAPGLAALVLRTLATFTIMATLWGMWSSDSLEQWLSLWSGTGALWLILLVMVISCYLAAFRLQRWDRGRVAAPATAMRRPGKPVYHWRMAAPTVLGAVALLLVGSPAFYSNLNNTLGNVIETARDASRLNERDRKKLEQGYYEQLLSVNVTSGLFEMRTGEAPENERDDSTVWQRTNDVLDPALKPGDRTLFKGEAFSVNSHGMRDREYSLQKPPGTVRIALLGSSHTMGSGVADGEPFEALVEARLNGDVPEGQPANYELLNFAVGGYSALQGLYLLETKVSGFEPDLVVIVAHLQDEQRLKDSISNLVRDGRPMHYPEIDRWLRSAGIEAGMAASVVRHRLQPVIGEIQAWIYARIAAEAKRHGATPVWVFLPAPYQRPSARELEERLRFAGQAGFTALSLAGAYDGHEAGEVQVSQWDTHPNALGHRLVAARFYQEFSEAGLLRRSGSLPEQAPDSGISRAVQ